MIGGSKTAETGEAGLEALAAFRLALREFLVFSERNAKRLGLTPQQHQALLSIRAGYPNKTRITIGELAKHLLLKHHSTVELAGRMEKAGLVRRTTSGTDKRIVLLELTEKAEPLLAALSRDNLDALRRAAPAITELMRSLSRELERGSTKLSED